MEANANIRQEILKLEDQLLEADASQEIDTRAILEELLDEGALMVGPKGELYDKAFILKAHGPQRVPFKKVTVEEMKLTCYENMATVYSINEYVMEKNSFRLRFYRVWRKQNDNWKVIGGTTTMLS